MMDDHRYDMSLNADDKHYYRKKEIT